MTMMFLIRFLLILLGLIGIIDSAYLIMRYQLLHLGIVLPCIIGLIFCGHGLFWQKIHTFLITKIWLKRIWRCLWLGFFAWLCSFLSFAGYLHMFLKNQQNFNNQAVTAIIVLGSGFKDGKPTPVLASRLDTSAKLASQYPNALIILTGGVGFNKTVSEASVMQRYLQEKYLISSQNLRLEDKSTSTALNLQNSKVILSNEQIDLDKPIVIVTSDFHTLRALAIAKKQGFGNVSTFGATTPLYVRYNNWLREYFAFVSGWLLREY